MPFWSLILPYAVNGLCFHIGTSEGSHPVQTSNGWLVSSVRPGFQAGMAVYVGITLVTLALHCPRWHCTVHNGIALSTLAIRCPVGSTRCPHWHCTVYVGSPLSTLALHCLHWQSATHVGRTHSPCWHCTIHVCSMLLMLAVRFLRWHGIIVCRVTILHHGHSSVHFSNT
jgi:hypothetical protein